SLLSLFSLHDALPILCIICFFIILRITIFLINVRLLFFLIIILITIWFFFLIIFLTAAGFFLLIISLIIIFFYRICRLNDSFIRSKEHTSQLHSPFDL